MRLVISTLAILLLVAFAACGDDDDDEDAQTPPASGVTTTPVAGGDAGLNVELVDFSVVAPSSGSAGEVTFNIANSGPNHMHEFVVIRTELDAADLPIADDGSVDETGASIEVVGEVEEIDVGGSDTLTLDLSAGHYALICNVVDEQEGEMFVHYDRGMHTDFTVE